LYLNVVPQLDRSKRYLLEGAARQRIGRDRALAASRLSR